MARRIAHACPECGNLNAPFGMRLICAGGYVWACRDHRAAVFAAHEGLRPAQDRVISSPPPHPADGSSATLSPEGSGKFDASGQGVLL